VSNVTEHTDAPGPPPAQRSQRAKRVTSRADKRLRRRLALLFAAIHTFLLISAVARGVFDGDAVDHENVFVILIFAIIDLPVFYGFEFAMDILGLKAWIPSSYDTTALITCIAAGGAIQWAMIGWFAGHLFLVWSRSFDGRGRTLCPRCGYNRMGSGMTCPECGLRDEPGATARDEDAAGC
jgi:hypothetical protein